MTPQVSLRQLQVFSAVASQLARAGLVLPWTFSLV